MTDFLYFLLTVWGYSALAMSQVLLVMFVVIYKDAEYKMPLVPFIIIYLIAAFSMSVFLPYFAYTESFESLNKKYKQVYANCCNKMDLK
jgi:hypothetical protein